MTREPYDLPLIARIAGLPAEAVEEFTTDLDEFLAARWREEDRLAEARAALVDRLYAAIPHAPRDARRALLAVKRDCHNGRPLQTESDAYRLLLDVAGAEARRVAELERCLDAAVDRYVERFRAEERRQRRSVDRLLEDPLFRCGLAVASPQLARAAMDASTEPDRSDTRRRARITASVLRYASRAALKLSPLTTFTHVGIAQLESGGGGPTLASAWRHRSLVRLRRHLVDRGFDLLAEHRPLRRHLSVARSPSRTRADDGRTHFLRPSRYRVSGERTLVFEDEAIVKVRLEGPVVRALDRLLANGPIRYDDLVADLARALPNGTDEDALVRYLDRLIDVGYLNLLPPWSVDEPRAEATLLDALRRLDPEPALDALIADLDALIRLQDGLLETDDPVGDVLRMRRRVGDIFRDAARLGGHPEDVEALRRSLDHEIYQDVWCAPDASDEAVARVGRDSLETAVRSVTPLLRFARIFDPHHDFLAALGATLRDGPDERAELPILEAFDRAQPLWRDFVRFLMDRQRDPRGWRRRWNPLGLAAIDELARWRDLAADGLEECLSDGPEGRRISVARLEALLDRVPARFTEGHVGACLFLQPATADGALWVLNRLKEGTGRFASRYTALMDPPLRHRYGAAFAARGELELAGESVRLLDVQCVRGDTLNVHTAQTPVVLVMPGDSIDLPPERRRTLDELVVSIAEDGRPTIRDTDGARFLPVHLGVGYIGYMPPLFRFLCAFGPSETGVVFPPPWTRDGVDGSIQERTMIGNVVLHRRTWAFSARELRRLIAGRDDSEAFAELRRWRRRQRLPDRVFVLERVTHPIAGESAKPQYIDLSSPLFASIFRDIVEAANDTVAIVEMLPTPETFPRDGEGRRWAVELLVESLALSSPEDRARESRRVPAARDLCRPSDERKHLMHPA